MYMSKQSWIGLILLAMTTVALIALNQYVLSMTNGCYNALDVLFM
jgi:hypothetical protein